MRSRTDLFIGGSPGRFPADKKTYVVPRRHASLTRVIDEKAIVALTCFRF